MEINTKLEFVKAIFPEIFGNVNAAEKTVTNSQKDPNIGKYCVIRTYSAGVHVGVVESVTFENGVCHARLSNSRRIHCWYGAASLSQMAIDGLPVHNDTRVAMPIDITVINVIEIIPCSEKAESSIKNYAVWKK